jgi:hypothetical protein
MLNCTTCGRPVEEHDYTDLGACYFVCPETAYTLRDYTRSGGGEWVAAEYSPWSLAIRRNPDGIELGLSVGDMSYHSIPLEFVKLHGAKHTAEVFNETDAAADIEQILLAALRLL